MTEPPPKERLPDASHTPGTIQEGGGAEVEGTEGQVHVGPMRQEPTRAGRKRQQGREVTLAGRRRREVTLAGRRRREVTRQVGGGVR